MLLILLLSGCGVDLANPPRLATATARAAATATNPPPPLVLAAPTSTPSANAPAMTGGVTVADDPAPAPLDPTRLTVWVNETSLDHQRVLDELAAEFADSRGVDVAIQLISPSLLPELVSTGILSGTLPDIVVHPLEFTAGWVEDGILDPTASAEVVEQLGRDSFDPAALELVTVAGQVAALPSDGFHQLILYRVDWYQEQGLRAPDTFTAMQSAAEAIFNPEAIISGLVIPTESNLITTHQAFEQMALANGCRLIDESGEVIILEPACREAIEHYYTTINRFSPSGVQTDTSARNALLEGRTGLIITSPAILPDLAGLNSAAMPSCPECVADESGINYLARNTGILTEIRGPDGDPTAFGNMTLLGITTSADRDAAQAFAEFWFNEGYDRWLAVNSERKVPMRLGTSDSPRGFIDNWGLAPLGESGVSLTDIYGSEVVTRLRDGIAAAPRWGLREGYGALMSRLYDDYIISIVLQEMLSGYFGTETTLNEAYRRAVDLIPNYTFPFLLDEEELAP